MNPAASNMYSLAAMVAGSLLLGACQSTVPHKDTEPREVHTATYDLIIPTKQVGGSHNNDPKGSIYGERSIEEIVDSIYSDTLLHRDYFNPDKPDTFYLRRIVELAELIRFSSSDSSSLFPGTSFDEVVARQAHPFEGRRGYEATYGSAIPLSKNQAQRLLSLLNNPVNFNWGECGTWVPSVRFEFRHQGNVVRVLDDGCTGQFRTEYPRIKFGSLTSPRRAEYKALLGEIGIHAE
ncbi:MAG TPA: hypothetical protein PKY96_12955 [Flavobacteriales bacterium]|nr:hypothetical protein [Flavobacteriales bacterium]